MQAVILAGGIGSRLHPYTADIPKPLVPIDDKPIIEYLLYRMKKNGVTDIVMAVNHLSQLIEEKIGDGKSFGMNIKYSHEPKPLSTAAPLKLIDNLNDHFMVANGDILTDLDFSKLFESHQKSQSALTVAVHKRLNKIDYGVIDIDNNGVVKSFDEKPTHDYLVSMGIYMFSKEVLKYIPDDEPFGFDDLMLKLLENKIKINTFAHEGFWLDIGRVEDYLLAQENIKQIKSLLE